MSFRYLRNKELNFETGRILEKAEFQPGDSLLPSHSFDREGVRPCNPEWEYIDECVGKF